MGRGGVGVTVKVRVRIKVSVSGSMSVRWRISSNFIPGVILYHVLIRVCKLCACDTSILIFCLVPVFFCRFFSFFFVLPFAASFGEKS